MCSNCEGYYDDQYYREPYDEDEDAPLAVLDEEDLDVNEALDLLREAA